MALGEQAAPSPWAQALREFTCEHDLTAIRKRIASNGVAHWPKQCCRCGQHLGFVAKATLSATEQSAAEPFDDDLREAWQQQISQRAAELREQSSTNWWDGYSEYLRSPEWRWRRERVLERDRYQCQARLLGTCTGRATQVHHLTYKHVRNEPLFELESVCEACHELLTDLDRTC